MTKTSAIPQHGDPAVECRSLWGRLPRLRRLRAYAAYLAYEILSRPCATEFSSSREQKCVCSVPTPHLGFWLLNTLYDANHTPYTQIRDFAQ